ncbi:MAG: exodeoxyribonuclease VII large subunit, partial [Verrucomicrobiota bacterium]
MSEANLFDGQASDSVWTVSELTDEVKRVLESGFGTVQVSGEISNFRRQASGHLYFSLKDEDAQLASVMFRGDANRLK